ncbi:lysine N(6)-hydroxylase/L-ornithine N(5)-oxygenase family protein [Microbacterium oxydans]|uniref:lysine N(6)-hydroxylase/L-ornithine N(5)-oxygenase family protein n=1 Tax=Microbacterium oxydans TaxID=82380 RepID=UPI00367354D1
MNAGALDEGNDVPETVDVVGVGFGPANLAIAIALREHAEEGRPLEAVFFEAQEEPTWHPGMLLEDASMQISFLKDLVTFRNPVSPYSFVAFLHQRQRLVDFTNRGCAEPLRIEFAAYLRWVAEAFVDVVRYGSRVERVTPVRIEGEVEAFDVLVASADGVRTVRARSVIVAAGLRPRFPAGIAPGTRVWHSADHVHRVGQLRTPRRLAVVGTGQSAMEVALDLSDRFPEATVHVISSQFGVAPSDQGPLVNRIFDPASVDLLFDATDAVRTRLDVLHRNANNGVASSSVIRAFFDRMYRDAWLDRERLVLHRVSRIVALEEAPSGVELRVQSDLDGDVTSLHVDAVVFGTGYRPFDTAELLQDDVHLLRRDDAGRPVLRRDHSATLTEPGSARLVLVGQSEHQHGLTSTLLSTTAVRAGEIADALVAEAAENQHSYDRSAGADTADRKGTHVTV